MTARSRLRAFFVALALPALALAGLAAVQAGSSRPAAAAEITDAITGVSVREEASDYYGRVHVDIAWSVPEDATAGDTFTLQLPPELDALTRGFELRAPDGSVVATATIADGVVTFTLTSYVDSHTAVSGTAFIESSWNRTETEPGATNTVVFHTSTEVFSDQVEVGPIGVVDRTTGRKYGYWSDQVDQGEEQPEDALRWVLEAPVGPWDTLVFDDQVSDGHQIDCASVSVFTGSQFDAGGNATDLAAMATARYTVACTTGQLVVTTADIADQELVQVRYATTVTTPGLDSYANDATITADGEIQPVQSTVIRSDAGGEGGGTATTTSTTTATTSTSSTTTSTSSTTTSTPPTSTSTSTTPLTPSTSTTVVVSPTSIVRPPSSGSPSGPGVSSTRLPRTGADSRPATAIGVTLLLAGAALVIGTRRKRLRRG